MNNRELFSNQLEESLGALFSIDPRYQYVSKIETPKSLADKIVSAAQLGYADVSGEAVKATCRKLGIKVTIKAIKEYLNEYN